MDVSKYTKLYIDALRSEQQEHYYQVLEEDAEKAFIKLCECLKWNHKLVFADGISLYYLYVTLDPKFKLNVKRIKYEIVSAFVPKKIWQKISHYIHENRTMPVPEVKHLYGYYIRKNKHQRLDDIEYGYTDMLKGKIFIDRKNYILEYYHPIPEPVYDYEYDEFKKILFDTYGPENIEVLFDFIGMVVFEKRTDMPKIALHVLGKKKDSENTMILLSSIYPHSIARTWKTAKNRSLRLALIEGARMSRYMLDFTGDTFFVLFNEKPMKHRWNYRNMISIEEAGKKSITDYDFKALCKKNIGMLIKNEIWKRFEIITKSISHNRNQYGYKAQKVMKRWVGISLVDFIISQGSKIMEKQELHALIKKHKLHVDNMMHALYISKFITNVAKNLNTGQEYYVFDFYGYLRQMLMPHHSEKYKKWEYL
jgi:hypothetical protein